jgi:hypothetical protein
MALAGNCRAFCSGREIPLSEEDSNLRTPVAFVNSELGPKADSSGDRRSAEKASELRLRRAIRVVRRLFEALAINNKNGFALHPNQTPLFKEVQRDGLRRGGERQAWWREIRA